MANIPFKVNSLELNNQIITTTGNSLYINGSELYLSSNSSGFLVNSDLLNASGALSTRLGATGATLISLISAASAGVSSINGTSGIITLNGGGDVNVTTVGQTITISGNTGNLIGYATLNNLLLTGQQAWQTAQNNASNLSGNLQSTGSNLDNKINSLSGYSNNTFATQTSLNTTNTNLIQSGVVLGAKIDSLSGYSNNNFATITNLQNTGQNLYNLLTGASGVLNTSGVLDAKIQSTGSFLFGLINASSAGISSINSKSGVLTMTGGGNVSVISTNQNFIISGNTGDLIGYATLNNLQQTGQQAWTTANTNSINLSGNLQITGSTLDNKINSLSGYSNAIFATQTSLNTTNSNLTSTGVTLGTKIDSLSGYSNNTFATVANLLNTGQQSYNLIVNLSGRLDTTGTNLQNQINTLTSNLTQTGVIIESQINSLSGYSNNTFATIANLASTGQNNWIIANNNGINLSGNLQTTGSNLDNKINLLSGYSNTTFSTQVSLNTTNSNLTSTGVTLGAKIDSLSGYSNATFATISNLQTTGQNLYILLTGESGSLLNTINATGSLLYNLIGVSNAGVSTLNGQSGNILLTGTGNIFISNNGQTIIISGNTGDLIGYSTINNLYNTGSILDNKVNSLSGTVYSNFIDIIGTGNINVLTGSGAIYISGQFLNVIDSGNFQTQIDNTNTNLSSTGTILNNRITSLSGYVNGLPLGTIINNVVTGNGTLGFIPKFIASNSGIANSIIFNTGFTVGINNNNPVEDLDISGTILVHNNDSINILYSTGTFASYQQINIKNLSNSTNASSDLVTTADIGNETNFYANLGINSSTYTGSSVGYSGDAYLFSQANDLYIGNATVGKKVLFFAGNNATGINNSLMSMDGSVSQVRVSGNLFASGGQILTTTDSGNINVNIASTGQQNYNISIGSATNLSGNLQNTGIALINAINSLTGSVSINGVGNLVKLTDALGNQCITSGQNILVGILNTGQVFLTSNIIMANTGTFSPIISGLVGSGKWMIEGSINMRSTANAAFSAAAIITDGTNCYGYSEGFAAAAGTSMSGVLPLDLPMAFATFTTPTFVSIFAMSSLANTVACSGGTYITGLFNNNRFGNVGTQTTKLSYMRIG